MNQDKKWLQEAMQSFTVDEGKRMRELLDVLRTPDVEAQVDAKEGAFDELMILIETIDNARGTAGRPGGMRMRGVRDLLELASGCRSSPVCLCVCVA
jgi:hypothetical protein